MVVAAIGIVVNLATAMLFLRGQEDLNVRGAFLHMAADAAVSAGVVVAAGLTLWLGWNWLDPVASLLIVAVILIGTWGLFRDSLHLMFDGVPASIDIDAVRARGLARGRLRQRPARVGHRDDAGRADGASRHARRPPRRRLLPRRRGAHAGALCDRPRDPAGGDRRADGAMRRAGASAA
jgi:hypothetical protein